MGSNPTRNAKNMDKRQLLDRNRVKLFRVCKNIAEKFRLNPEDINDIFQDTCVNFLSRDITVPNDNAFYSIFVNTLKDAARNKQAIKRKFPATSKPIYSLIPCTAVDFKKTYLDCQEYTFRANQDSCIVDKWWPETLLSSKEENLLDFLLAGHCDKDIGKFLGSSPSAVRVRIHRLRKKLSPYKGSVVCRLI